MHFLEIMEMLMVSLLCFSVATVSGQQLIVSQQIYTSGDTFNLTCDASKFVGLSATNYFVSMSLLRRVSPQINFEIIASYDPFSPTNTTTNFPAGRQWEVYYTGGQSSTNRNTMKIVVTVVNYQCTDAGLYKCRVEAPQATTYETSPVNLTAKVPVVLSNISMTPHKQTEGRDEQFSENNVGECITLTCIFTGPANLQPVWKLKKENSIFEEDYPYSENISNSVLVSSVVSGCTFYNYTSVLQFTLEETDDGNEYICVVIDGNNEESRKMFTLGVSSTPIPINHTSIIMTPHNGNDPYSSTNFYGENITLTCAASGPSSLQISWNYTVEKRNGEIIPSFQVSNFTSSRDADASGSTCSTVSLTSALVVKPQEPGDIITYYCIVSDNGVEQSIRNFTIHIVLSSTTTNISSTTLSTCHNAGACATMGPMKLICFVMCVSIVMRFSSMSFSNG